MDETNQKLEQIKNFLQLREGWDLNELIEEMVAETKLLKHKEMGDHTLATDECGIEWSEDSICVLSDFVDDYTRIFIKKVCNVLDSFKEKEEKVYEVKWEIATYCPKCKELLTDEYKYCPDCGCKLIWN